MSIKDLIAAAREQSTYFPRHSYSRDLLQELADAAAEELALQQAHVLRLKQEVAEATQPSIDLEALRKALHVVLRRDLSSGEWQSLLVQLAPKPEAQTCPECEGRGGEYDVSCTGKDCSWCCPTCNGTGKVGGGK